RPPTLTRISLRDPLPTSSHQALSAHGEGAFKSYSTFRGLKFQRHAHARVSQPPCSVRGRDALACTKIDLMPVSGGSADKFGNRYEALWAIDQLLRIVDGSANLLTPEPIHPDDSRAIAFEVIDCT